MWTDIAYSTQKYSYKKTVDPVPLPIKWGIENEYVARQKYKELVNHILSVEQCGFFVHPWLGASPDGVVIDHCCTLRDYWNFILNYTNTSDLSFYCTSVSGIITRCSFSFMFVPVSTIGVTSVYTHLWVERITLDKHWTISKLEDYYDNFIVPELVYPMHKPAKSYIIL